MNPRTEPRVVPDKRRFWTVVVDDDLSYSFRFPYYQSALAVVEFVAECPQPEQATQASVAGMLPYMGAAIGCCWFHVEQDLDAVLDLDSLEAYGHAVADELQDDLSLMQIVGLFNAVVSELSKRLEVQTEAEETAVFSKAPEAPPTT